MGAHGQTASRRTRKPPRKVSRNTPWEAGTKALPKPTNRSTGRTQISWARTPEETPKVKACTREHKTDIHDKAGEKRPDVEEINRGQNRDNIRPQRTAEAAALMHKRTKHSGEKADGSAEHVGALLRQGMDTRPQPRRRQGRTNKTNAKNDNGTENTPWEARTNVPIEHDKEKAN